MNFWQNTSFWAAFFSWIFAQTTKMIIEVVQTRKINFGCLVRNGGMPSAHSAMAGGLATSVGLEGGFGSPLFAVACAFAGVVMLDASTVRRSAGLQAILLNEMIDVAFKEHRFAERKLVEILGHTRLEVIMGMTLGIVTALWIQSWMCP